MIQYYGSDVISVGVCACHVELLICKMLDSTQSNPICEILSNNKKENEMWGSAITCSKLTVL